MKNFLLKTKENSLHNFKERSWKWHFGWIAVAFLVLFGGKEVVGTIASYATTPFYYVRHYIQNSQSTIPIFIRTRIELQDEIQKLQEEIASQKGSDMARAYIEEENKTLRALLHASSTPRVVAGVISRPPSTPYDTIMIDRGSDDGIVAFAPVYYGSGMAMGYVRTVFSHTALITLFSSPGVVSTVYIVGPNIFTSAYGEGGGVVRLSIPQGILIAKGNIVILPSIDTGVLGTIHEIQSIPTEPEQHAYLTFDIPLQSIRLVTVGTIPVKPISITEAETRIRDEERRLFTFPAPSGAQAQFGSSQSSTTQMSTDVDTNNSTST